MTWLVARRALTQLPRCHKISGLLLVLLLEVLEPGSEGVRAPTGRFPLRRRLRRGRRGGGRRRGVESASKPSAEPFGGELTLTRGMAGRVFSVSPPAEAEAAEALSLSLSPHLQLPGVLDEADESGDMALDLALLGRQHSIADTLLKHGASVTTTDPTGASLLHRAVRRGDEFSASFLMNHGCSVNVATPGDGRTPLHTLVSQNYIDQQTREDMVKVAQTMIEKGADPNIQDKDMKLRCPHLRQKLEFAPQCYHCCKSQFIPNDFVLPSLLLSPIISSSPSQLFPLLSFSPLLPPLLLLNSSPLFFSSPPSPLPSSPSPLPSPLLPPPSLLFPPLPPSSSSPHFPLLSYLPFLLLSFPILSHPLFLSSLPRTVLHLTVEGEREEIFRALIEHDNLRLELRDKAGYPVLWYSLKTGTEFGETSYAAQLIKKGASPDAVSKGLGWRGGVIGSSGESLLHLVARDGMEEAGLFLTTQGASCNVVNADGETPLHVSCTIGANPNLQTYSSSPAGTPIDANDPFAEETEESPTSSLTFRETPLHRAIKNKNEDDIRAILDHKGAASSIVEYCESNKVDSIVMPDLNLRDSDDLTPLGVALGTGQINVAKQLLEAGADINTTDSQGYGLLHMAIQVKEVQVATFLINNGADVNLRTRDGESPLQLCISESLGAVVGLLCGKGADHNSHPNSPEPPLWQALDSKQEDIASTLVQYHVDTDGWAEGPEGCLQTLLHKAIDENREDIACFLVRSGCDVNAVRKPGPGGGGGDAATDQMTPLHLCCSWGLENTVQTLLEHGAKVNARDAENKTPLHHAIENGHNPIISLLLSHPALDLSLRDKSGITPFAAAMSRKNNKAAQAILSREPKAAEQYDHKGHNFLHVAIQKKDMESVLFLLSIHVDMHTRTQDQLSLTPLHLATLSGSEMIVRNLLLAGGGAINELTPQKQTVLHLAAANDHPHLVSIFLENGVRFDAVDDNHNNALHVAVKEGHLSVVRVLLTESRINAEAVNLRGQNPLHVLANYPKDNAAAIAEMFLETMPDYDLNRVDVEGNSALLLAYMRGAGQLCRVLVRSGACLGSTNKHGVNIFNYQVPTKALLFRLLDVLSAEPPWSEGELCMECGTKFGLATRKHHCRHCGRLLCSRCSDKDVPILKFSLNKPVRVCQTCFDVLTLGPAAIS
ncbi:Ankyrin repeat and FYVE domain-containing protein 1 [Penaeus vannamei]|uniref:Ankyrin repeat and FYVE domain-containing protein 1 n=1 Tax=Penaeus vannamei TaxID=6689 RepID=A0A423SAZ8_PENVA|nr:Ankyrin repeat and FYVE domain-containing protein 1 [Penaeus vannamei]